MFHRERKTNNSSRCCSTPVASAPLLFLAFDPPSFSSAAFELQSPRRWPSAIRQAEWFCRFHSAQLINFARLTIYHHSFLRPTIAMADYSEGLRPVDADFVNAVLDLIVNPNYRINEQTQSFWDGILRRYSDMQYDSLIDLISSRVASNSLPPEAFNDPRIQQIIAQRNYDVGQQGSTQRAQGASAAGGARQQIPSQQTDPSPLSRVPEEDRGEAAFPTPLTNRSERHGAKPEVETRRTQVCRAPEPAPSKAECVSEERRETDAASEDGDLRCSID